MQCSEGSSSSQLLLLRLLLLERKGSQTTITHQLEPSTVVCVWFSPRKAALFFCWILKTQGHSLNPKPNKQDVTRYARFVPPFFRSSKEHNKGGERDERKSLASNCGVFRAAVLDRHNSQAKSNHAPSQFHGSLSTPLLHCSHTLQNVKNDQAPFFLTQKPDVAIHLGIKKKGINPFFSSRKAQPTYSLSIYSE